MGCLALLGVEEGAVSSPLCHNATDEILWPDLDIAALCWLSPSRASRRGGHPKAVGATSCLLGIKIPEEI